MRLKVQKMTVFLVLLFTAMILTFKLRKCSIILISLSCLLTGPTPRNYRHPGASRACHQEGSGGQVQVFGAPKLRVQVSDAAVVQRRDEGQLQVWSLTQFYSVYLVKFTDRCKNLCFQLTHNQGLRQDSVLGTPPLARHT